jgi:hypothetical protein
MNASVIPSSLHETPKQLVYKVILFTVFFIVFLVYMKVFQQFTQMFYT